MNLQNFTFNGGITAGQIAVGNHNVLTSAAAALPPPGGGEPVFGIVTALPEEFAAMLALLDAAGPPRTIAGDRAQYVLGRLPSADGSVPHRVVLTLLGDTGNAAAAESCANLIRSFPSVTTVVMCGIACGVPNPGNPDRHVRLGDIVVGTWGIADYDHVVETDQGRRARQAFPLPSPVLVRTAGHLAAMEIFGERPWESGIDTATAALEPRFARPADATDRAIAHPPAELSGHRPGRPKVLHGLIGSADRSLRSAPARDEIAQPPGIIALEMEGKGIGSAGFAGGLEWFVVRGISDYGDSGANRLWRGYAAVVAAAYVRALLARCAPQTARGGHSAATGQGDLSAA